MEKMERSRRRIIRAGAVFAVLLLGPWVAPGLAGAEESQTRTLSVVGRGSYTSPAPDRWTIIAGIVARGREAGAALDAHGKAMTEIASLLGTHGLTGSSVRRGGLDLRPVEANQGQQQQNRPRQITGYEAVQEISVDVAQTGTLGKVIDALTQRAEAQVYGVISHSGGRDGAERRAYDEAIDQARTLAQMQARKLDVRLGRVVSASSAPVRIERDPRQGPPREWPVEVLVEFEIR